MFALGPARSSVRFSGRTAFASHPSARLVWETAEEPGQNGVASIARSVALNQSNLIIHDREMNVKALIRSFMRLV